MDDFKTIAQGHAAIVWLTNELRETDVSTNEGKDKIRELTARITRITKIIKECGLSTI